MKLKIYQQGGGLIYTPFIPEQYTGTTSNSKRSSGSDEDSKIDPLDKELLGLMKDQNLLPSDIQMIFDRLISFQRRTQSLSSSMLGGDSSYRSVMPGMLQIMNYLSQAKYSKAADDKIVNQMMNENAGNEFALDGYGRMYVMTEDGKVTKIEPSSFNNEKHRPLSNSELLYLRENKPELALDTEIFEDMRNMVGMSTVSKEIDRIIKAFGTEEGQRYLSKETAQIFSDLNTPDGAYKLTMKVPASGLKQAWKTIYDQLPTNMQNLIKIRAAVSGDTKETFISDIVLHNSSTTQNIDYDATMSKAAGYETDPLKAKKESAEQLTQNNYLQQIGTLQGMPTRIDIYPRASKIHEKGALNAAAYTFGRVINRQNQPISKMSVSEMMNEGWAFAAGVPGNVIFGNKLMKDHELEALLFDDQSNLTAVLLPYTYSNGHIVPDFELFDKYNKLQNAIKNSSMTKMEIQTLASNLGLDPRKFTIEDGIVEIKDTMAFLTVSAYAGDDTLDLDKDDKRYLEKVEKDDGQHIKDLYNNMVMYGKLRPAKKGNVAIKGYSKSGKNDFWKGNVFIPMQNAYYSLLLSGIGEYVPKSDMTNYLERTVAKERYDNAVQYMYQNDPYYNVHQNIGQFKDE